MHEHIENDGNSSSKQENESNCNHGLYSFEPICNLQTQYSNCKEVINDNLVCMYVCHVNIPENFESNQFTYLI